MTPLILVLSQLWGLINGLSLFVHLPMTGVDIPDQTKDILSQLIEVAQFDLLPNEDVYGWAIPFSAEHEEISG